MCGSWGVDFGPTMLDRWRSCRTPEVTPFVLPSNLPDPAQTESLPAEAGSPRYKGIALRARRARARSPSHEKVSRDGVNGAAWRSLATGWDHPRRAPGRTRALRSVPVCGKPCTQTIRYPQALCDACARSATDLGGRPVRFSNVSLLGGFIAHHRDDDSVCAQVTNDGRVLDRRHRVRCRRSSVGGDGRPAAPTHRNDPRQRGRPLANGSAGVSVPAQGDGTRVRLRRRCPRVNGQSTSRAGCCFSIKGGALPDLSGLRALPCLPASG